MTTHEPANTAPADPSPGSANGYETRDASVPALLTFGISRIVVVIVVQYSSRVFFPLFESDRPTATKITPTENLYQQLRDLHRHEDDALGSYGWVDREAGIVRIPIDQAIKRVATKG